MNYRIGVDVGGTHTDAALLDEKLHCLATAKVSTTHNVTEGVANAIAVLLERAPLVARDQVAYAMLGTTHCTNALVQREGMQRVGLLRLAAPATEALPPQSGWPADLVEVISVRHATVRGGFEYDGRVLGELDESEVRSVLRGWRGEVDAIAICGVFSPLDNGQERQVAEWVLDELGAEVAVSLSSEIGSVGLLERENATVLNASLGRVARAAIAGFRRALQQSGLERARLFLGQNDGTLMTLEAAEIYPILTLGCGPTNSLRGAAFLSGLRDALVVDVGGTTADIGVLIDGFPRESASAVEIGGIRLNLRMPDILSLGLGGGTVVREVDGKLVLGPDSVGYRLTSEAQCFGGETLTLTDAAVAIQAAPAIGPVRVMAPKALCQRAFDLMVEQIEDGIDRMKIGAHPVPVVLVGGGGMLFPDKLAGALRVVRPQHFGAANAIGVAIAEISGEIDRIVSMPPEARTKLLDALREEALSIAIGAGAQPAGVRVLSEDLTPMAYLPGHNCRVRIKAAGPLAPSHPEPHDARPASNKSSIPPSRGVIA
jgi:N-methylhydantoinase A/oxoprolinase/acetone carboxylase beta subunit